MASSKRSVPIPLRTKPRAYGINRSRNRPRFYGKSGDQCIGFSHAGDKVTGKLRCFD